MQLDAVSFSVTAVGGAVAWEVVKQLGAAWLKRRGEAGSAARKAIGEHCAALNKSLIDISGKAVEYLTSDCNDARRKELARLVVHETKLLAASVKQLNLWAAELGLLPLSSTYLIDFRRAVTMQLDQKGYVAQRHEAPDVKRVYETALAMQEALTRLHVASNFSG